jgi:hypothetical protein
MSDITHGGRIIFGAAYRSGNKEAIRVNSKPTDKKWSENEYIYRYLLSLQKDMKESLSKMKKSAESRSLTRNPIQRKKIPQNTGIAIDIQHTIS